MTRRALALFGCILVLGWLSTWIPLGEKPSPVEPSSLTLQAPTHSVNFKRDVLPILSAKCFTCHGPDASARKANLRLDQRDAALKTARSKATPIVPGKPDDSEVVRRIFADSGDERMPPAKAGKPLTAAEKELLKRWISDGAPYEVHWAFVKPERPKAPAVKNKAWVRNEIDAFVLAKLEAAGLEPSPRADAVTLIRRLSLDLRGLPPSPEEVNEFLSDSRANPQAAWEKAVERMLASPHYGEKMALTWLDLARYGDTSGYHMDSTRQMWLWRDWVIDAFNRDMPFDAFTIQQLAGDLLAKDEGGRMKDEKKTANSSYILHPSSLIASGFNRNTRYNEEGGVDPEEYVIRYNVDRTNTLGQIWLGLTLGCAECHSHKYDPISHKEYYQLFAYFTGIKEPMLEGHSVHGRPLEPLLKVPTAEQSKAVAENRKMLAVIEKALAKELDRYVYVDPLEGKPLPDEITDALAEQSQRAWEARAKFDLKLPADIGTIVHNVSAKRTEAQKKYLRHYYIRKVHAAARDVIGPIGQDYEDHLKKLKDIDDAVPYTLITEEMPTPRPAHVLIRGDFQQKGERVAPGVPATLSPLPKQVPANRLGLARWLVSPENPLTARVTVNRLWAQVFGQGIVRTAGDFGTQGDYPSHPELLDWLASELVLPSPLRGRGVGGEGAASPWSLKHLLRTIALSSTYQQSSIYRKDAVKLDPHNRLLAFMPRFRLGAEELRDSALTISGVMNAKVGGPSFMPYQPRDYYQFKNEEWPWTASPGDEQYRRGLYGFWRRTALHPMFVSFDAPTREECTVLRARTNTPLQALVTLNDPTFVEAARVFAQRLLTDGPKTLDARLRYVFQKATCRAPSDAEFKVLQVRFEQQRKRFTADAEAAARFVNAGQYPLDPRLDVREHAAWMAICNMVLNLDEVLTRE